MTADHSPTISSSAIRLSAVISGEVDLSNAPSGFRLLLSYPTYAT
jgi:hypothetical protein